MKEKLVLEAHCQLEILGIFEAVGTFALWRLDTLGDVRGCYLAMEHIAPDEAAN